ncbi:hypothetical protein TIFTF001_018359 [Ficus carica]|uniref:RNase H type-1 domain-containing protein n=1 Tax=Ficus carica TaxID=3494 RepID=A0AA88AVE8_FICCA|nr:hypothetical protein TIFTF001_018359 [Ficus carica]
MDATSWRLDRVEKVFWNVDRLDGCSIPLGYRSRPDSLVWHYDSKGSYTVKTGYRLAMKLRFKAGGSDGNARCLWWRKVWKAHVPNKAKTHACFSKQHLSRQGMNISPLCPLCHVEFETTSRALWYCGLTKGECLAAREGVLLANALGFQSWIMESNAINVVKAIRFPALQAPEALIIHDIRDVMIHVTSGNVRYASRQENFVAYFLATFAISLTSNII